MKTGLSIVAFAAMLCLLALTVAGTYELWVQNQTEVYRDYLVCTEAARFDRTIVCPKK